MDKLLNKLSKRWRQAFRVNCRFLQHNSVWLHEHVCLPSRIAALFPSDDYQCHLRTKSGGRTFSYSPPLILHEPHAAATASWVRLEARRSAANLVEAAASPCHGAQLLSKYASLHSGPMSCSAEEALTLLCRHGPQRSQNLYLKWCRRTKITI